MGFDRTDHLVDVGFDALTWLHDRKTLIKRPPFEHFDVHMARTPLVHGRLGRAVEIDGAGADESRTVIVHLINIRLALDLEFGADRVNGPVCGGASHSTKLEDIADGTPGTVNDVIAFTLGVSGRLHIADGAAGTQAHQLSRRDFGNTLAGGTTRAQRGQQEQTEVNHFGMGASLYGPWGEE